MPECQTEEPLVSVVVPAYNNAPFIADTLDSILGQTYRKLELIISDHSSDDGTWEICQQYARDPRVTLMRTERSSSPGDNWTAATDAATGKYLKLVCGDDLLKAHCLESQVAAMEANDNAVMTASRRDVVTALGRVLLKSWGLPGMLGVLRGPDAVRKAVSAGTNTFGEPACVLVRRRALVEIGGWDDRFPYIIDQHTYSKVLMHGEFIGLPSSLATFRLSDSQWSYALAKSQYRQVRQFHLALSREYPGLVSRRRRVLAGARTGLLCYARRFAYLSLARELRTPSIPVPGISTGVPGLNGVAE